MVQRVALANQLRSLLEGFWPGAAAIFAAIDTLRRLFHLLRRRNLGRLRPIALAFVALVAFLAYCLQVTLKQRLRTLAPGLTPRSVLEKMAAMQMVDVHLPTTDGRTIILARYAELEPDQALLLQQLKIGLPDQPPPRIMSNGTPMAK